MDLSVPLYPYLYLYISVYPICLFSDSIHDVASLLWSEISKNNTLNSVRSVRQINLRLEANRKSGRKYPTTPRS